MFIAFTFFIFIIGILLCYIREKSFASCKITFLQKSLNFLSNKKYNEYFVNTMIAFLGVTVAIAFANLNTEQQEKAQTIEFLEDVLRTELGIKATDRKSVV